MAENLGAPASTAVNGKEQSWRLTFELPDVNGNVEISVHRRVILRDASNVIVDRTEEPDLIEFLFPGSKFKAQRSLTLAELEAASPGITVTLNNAIDTAVATQKAAE